MAIKWTDIHDIAIELEDATVVLTLPDEAGRMAEPRSRTGLLSHVPLAEVGRVVAQRGQGGGEGGVSPRERVGVVEQTV